MLVFDSEIRIAAPFVREGENRILDIRTTDDLQPTYSHRDEVSKRTAPLLTRMKNTRKSPASSTGSKTAKCAVYDVAEVRGGSFKKRDIH